jgi:hypothetical protein
MTSPFRLMAFSLHRSAGMILPPWSPRPSSGMPRGAAPRQSSSSAFQCARHPRPPPAAQCVLPESVPCRVPSSCWQTPVQLLPKNGLEGYTLNKGASAQASSSAEYSIENESPAAGLENRSLTDQNLPTSMPAKCSSRCAKAKPSNQDENGFTSAQRLEQYPGNCAGIGHREGELNRRAIIRSKRMVVVEVFHRDVRPRPLAPSPRPAAFRQPSRSRSSYGPHLTDLSWPSSLSLVLPAADLAGQ